MGWYIPIFNPKVMCASLPWRGPAAARDTGDTSRYSCSCRARRGSRTRLTSYGLSGLGGLGGLSTCTHHCTCIQAMLLILVVPRHHCITASRVSLGPYPVCPMGPVGPALWFSGGSWPRWSSLATGCSTTAWTFPWIGDCRPGWTAGGASVYIYIWYTIDGHRWIWWNHVESV